MTPQQIARLEKQLQQNHVDIQRLWKAAFEKPEPYVGIPLAVVPGGLTTDTTDTTPTTSTTTTTTGTTRGPCDPDLVCEAINDFGSPQWGFEVVAHWASGDCPDNSICPGCPQMCGGTSVIPRTGSGIILYDACDSYPIPYRGSWGAGGNRIPCFVPPGSVCSIVGIIWKPYTPVSVQFRADFDNGLAVGSTLTADRTALFTPQFGSPIIISASALADYWACVPTLITVTRTS